MVFVEGGTFQMGASNLSPNEGPIHTLTLNSFYISNYEVTVSEFKRFVDATGYKTDADREGWSYTSIWDTRKKSKDVNWQCDVGGKKRPESQLDHPVIHVSWNDAAAYCKWVGARLPTEAEWEYAARGGKKYLYSQSNDFDKVGWYSDNAGSKPHPVGRKQPNELELYDMLGNVSEWCSDWYSRDYYENSPQSNPQGPPLGEERVLRGGDWTTLAMISRLTSRYRAAPNRRIYHYGFRLARSAK